MAVWLIIALPPKPPEDPKKSKGSALAVEPLLLLVKVSAEELVFIFEEVEDAIIKSADVSCVDVVVDEAKSNRVSMWEDEAEETAVLDGLIKSLEKKIIKVVYGIV